MVPLSLSRSQNVLSEVGVQMWVEQKDLGQGKDLKLPKAPNQFILINDL